MKRLTIITICRNIASTIERTCLSIVNQTFQDFEWIVVDGASTDGTVDILKKYSNRIDIFISEPDKGVYDAMNKGIIKSTGEWLYFLGCDDYFVSENTLNNIFKNNKYNNYDVIYGDVECNTLDYNHKGKWSLDKLNYNRCHQAIFYKKMLFDKYGLYDLKYKICADHNFNLNWILDQNTKSLYINQIIAHYSNEGLSSKTKDEAFGEDFLTIIKTRGIDILNKDQLVHYYELGIKALKHQKEQEKFKLKMEYMDILNSANYRLGKLLLSPLRWIKKIFGK